MSRRQSRGASLLKKRRQQTRRRWTIIGGTIGALIIAAVLFFTFRPVDVPLPDNWDTVYEGLPQTESPEGYPQLGDPSAPIEVLEFSSFTCPACNQLHETTISNLHDFVESGNVRIVYVPVNNIGGAGADETARAGYCAQKQDMFWEMHDVMFYWQERVNPSERRLNAAAEEIGMDADAFGECLDSGDTRDAVERGMQEFQSRGLNSTPVVYLNDDRLENWGSLRSEIEQILGG
ncbi:MAG: DsbA family protein [Chloroflexi bacterium]|nr:DsbA family protein [Chloroflexota bacterium]